ncbi:MAG: hypothetical protein RLZZ28_2728 [Bacteroidota bacterium]
MIFFCCLSFYQTNAQNGLFFEKKYLYGGLAFKFSENYTDNKNRLVYTVYDEKRNDFSINIQGGYFINSNTAFGAQINYGHTRTIGKQLGSSGQLADVNLEKESWASFGTMKNFIPLGNKHRFFLYNLAMLGYVAKNSLEESTSQGVLQRTYSQDKSVELNLAPGLMVNVIKGFAVETGMQIAGFQYAWSNSVIDGVPTTKQHSVSGDFTINLLRLNLGFYYYFSIKGKTK